MLPDKLYCRVQYLSSHFSDKGCRNELKQLIENYIKNDQKHLL